MHLSHFNLLQFSGAEESEQTFLTTYYMPDTSWYHGLEVKETDKTLPSRLVGAGSHRHANKWILSQVQKHKIK